VLPRAQKSIMGLLFLSQEYIIAVEAHSIRQFINKDTEIVS